MKKIRKNSWVLLVGRKIFVTRAKGRFHCEFGMIDMDKIIGREYGCRISSHLGEEFVVQEPFFTDLLKKAKRGPQVMLPKDTALILAKTGIGRRSLVIDAGTGSGFAAMFLANYVKKVCSYERRREFYELARENLKSLGIKNVEIKHKDAGKGFEERNADLVLLDLENPEKIVRHAERALKEGGFLVVYCPFAEEVGRVVKEMERRGFGNVEIVENLQREWEVSFDKKGQSHMRARPFATFTGFLVFGRKMKAEIDRI